jgi:hypothetical protein
MSEDRYKVASAVLSFFVTLLIAFPAFGGTVFGPKQYIRTSGVPNTSMDTFYAPGQTGSLVIENGDSGGNNRITSAEIYLNGTKIFGPGDFKKSNHCMEKSVPLNNGKNMVNVELRSKPGSYIAISVTVPSSITLNITFPSDGAVIARPDILVEGTFTNTSGAETGVVVNGITAFVYGGNFSANHVPLEEGQNTVTVTATDTKGNSASASIKVNAQTTGNFIQLAVLPDSGVVPLQTTLKVDGSFSFPESVITYTGPGQVEFLENTNENEYKVKMTTPGIYYFTAKVNDADNQIHTDNIAVQTFDGAELDTLLQTKWMGMRQALAQNDIPTAVSYFADSKKDAYREIFTALATKLPQISQSLDDIQFIRMMYNSAEYDIRTTVNGSTYSYHLMFVKEANGLWKIRSF